MIPFNFDYYRPDSIDEAVHIYKELDSQGKEPVYYGGGSEIISMARVHNIHTKAVIDLKGIPECNVLGFQGDLFVVGSSVTLSRISESKLFPLLGKTGGRIADHTIQCKITLGGNIGGTIIYREAVLPLLLSDSYVTIAGENKLKQVPISEVFMERLHLARGEFIVQFTLGKEYTALPFVHVKKTKNEKIDYPLISIAAMKQSDKIRIAFSGVCAFPFRSAQVEDDLNDKNVPRETRVSNALNHLPAPVLNDLSGSDSYRKFVLKNTLLHTLETLEGVQ